MPIHRQNQPKHSDSDSILGYIKNDSLNLESENDFLQQQHEQQQQQQRRNSSAASTTSATTDMTLTTVSTSARTCFHCGNPGHMALHCHDRLAQHEQSQEGKTAFASFVAGGSKQDRMSDRRRYSLHHFYKLRAWIRQKQQQQQQSNGDQDSHANRVIDPISLAFEALTANGNTANGKNDCRCLRKYVFHSYRELFDQTIQQLEMRYKEYTLSNIDLGCCWQTILTQAVKDGTPAIFSDHNALRAYTLEKLTPRCRQLHHLILDHNNPFAKSIRALLLPPNPATTRQTNGDTTTNATTHESRPIVSVCSVGGGPGYDHIAICMVAHFLHQLTCSNENEDHSYQHVTVTTQTRVFDLYDESWAPIADELMECWNTVTEATATTAASSSSLSGPRKATSQMTMHHADLRMPLNAPSNCDLKDVIPNADLIVFQFVLHENAAFLQSLRSTNGPGHHDDDDVVTAIDQKTETAIGMQTTVLSLLCLDHDDDDKNKNDGSNAVVDMLRCAKVGALIVCTDSVHTMWPALQAMAALYGWTSMSNAQRHHNIVMGPNSFLLMERTSNLGN